MVGGEGLGPTGREVEQRPVAWALHGTGVGVERALGEGTVVVRAAVLDRVERAVAVEDADLGPVGASTSLISPLGSSLAAQTSICCFVLSVTYSYFGGRILAEWRDAADGQAVRYLALALTLVIIIVAILVLLAFAVWFTYNRMVSRRLAVDNSWAQIEAALQRRHDLIPNLVESVKGYASTSSRPSRRSRRPVAARRRHRPPAPRQPRKASSRRRSAGSWPSPSSTPSCEPPRTSSSSSAALRDRGSDPAHPPRLQRHGPDLQHADPAVPGVGTRQPVPLRAAPVLRRAEGVPRRLRR